MERLLWEKHSVKDKTTHSVLMKAEIFENRFFPVSVYIYVYVCVHSNTASVGASVLL